MVLFTSDKARSFFFGQRAPVIDGYINPAERCCAGFINSANYARCGNAFSQYQSFVLLMSRDSFLYGVFSLPENNRAYSG